uniref:Uncharacterized protein n=1 Tax=Glossina brevipalpis TaxID=37001 RepID=A0A1A9X3T9_9MUSC
MFGDHVIKLNCLRRIARHDEPQFSKDSIVNVMEKFVKTVNIMDDTILVPCRLMDRQVNDNTDIMPATGKDVTSNQHTQHAPKRSAVNSKNVHEFLHSSELFNLYNMLNALKNDLLWTGKDENDDEDEINVNELNREVVVINEPVDGKTDNASSSHPPANGTTTAVAITNSNNNNNNNGGGVVAVKGHIRRPSTASMASIASVSQMSDSESDISNENDSGVESESHKNVGSAESTSGSEDGDIETKKLANVDKATELAKRCRRHLNGLYQCLEQMTEAANYLTARYQSDIGGTV